MNTTIATFVLCFTFLFFSRGDRDCNANKKKQSLQNNAYFISAVHGRRNDLFPCGRSD